MNLHEIRIGVGWQNPHILKNPVRCSEPECAGVRIDDPSNHLSRVHEIPMAWICECRDAEHMGTEPVYGVCNVTMSPYDANIFDPDHRGYTDRVVDENFPYIYVCPDCRTHEHGRRRHRGY